MQKTQMSFLLQNRKKREIEIFAFRVIMFEPIKIYTCLASQNDRLNLSFVKDENTVGKKMATNGPKWPFILSDSFPIRVYLITVVPRPTLSLCPQKT